MITIVHNEECVSETKICKLYKLLTGFFYSYKQ